MAPGKHPLNIFRLNRGSDPPETVNWRLWLAVFSFGILGSARGLDEGLISGTLASVDFRNSLNLPPVDSVEYANIQATISSMVQIGSVGGAGLAFLVCDRIGRLWAVRELCVIWMLGIALFMANGGNLGMVYAGRFVAGLGIGQASVVAPVYLSEVSTRSLRGLCTTTFAGAVYIGIMLAYFANYGCELHFSSTQSARWLIPTSMHLMFAGFILCLSFFNKESPRYLMKRGRDSQAQQTLAYIRNLPLNDPYVLWEMQEIGTHIEEERAATVGTGAGAMLRELRLPANLYRIYLGVTIQLLTQWCGPQSITVYAPDFFLIAGVSGQEEKLFASCILGVVKLVGALICAFFLVDFIGRKRSLVIGITIQTTAMAYLAIYLSVVGTPNPITFTSSQKSASIGAIAMIYVASFGWALGWNGIQYLLNAEIYPLRIRALCSSFTMMLHFTNQYGANRAVPLMLLPLREGGMSPAGAFWFFVSLTLVGMAWAWFFIPETAGLSLEQLDRLFTLRWYQIGRKGQDQAKRDLQSVEEGRRKEQEQKQQAVAYVEAL